jgi:C4-dicarboxylate-specific signal transduction histidine kinase
VQTASAFAHDLNQPLLAISAYSEAALNALRRGAPDLAKLRRMIEGSFQQAQRAGTIVHDLSAHLTQAMHESANPESFDLNQLVRECVSDRAARAMGMAAPLLQLDETLPPVAGSRLRTGRIISTLLANADEASRRHEARVSQAGVTVRTCRDQGEAVVSVAHAGLAVPAEDAERIFSPFFSTKASGLGLGLSISRALAESQGGRLMLAPASGPGADFHLTIPLANSHEDDLPR